MADFDARHIPEPNSGCWLWLGATDSVGYGRICVDGKQIRSHRASWILHFGPIPDGKMVCHHCDNRACVNPRHLFLGVSRDNVRDMWAKGRASHPPRKQPRISASVVLAIRYRAAAGERKEDLAREYGISAGYAYGIASGAERTDV